MKKGLIIDYSDSFHLSSNNIHKLLYENEFEIYTFYKRTL